MSYPHLISLYHYLWIAPHVLLLAVAAVMFCRKLHKHYPIFFSYLLFDFASFCLVFVLSRLRVSGGLYANADLFARAGCAALSFGVIQELFASGLSHLVSMRRQIDRLLRWITISLVVLASLLVVVMCYGRANPGAFRPYWSMQALDVVQCALLLLVFLWYRFLGIRMSAVSFGIAVGMALAASVEFLVLNFKTYFVVQNGVWLDILSMAAYHAAVLVWLGFALVREPVAPESQASLPRSHEQAKELERFAQL